MFFFGLRFRVIELVLLGLGLGACIFVSILGDYYESLGLWVFVVDVGFDFLVFRIIS